MPALQMRNAVKTGIMLLVLIMYVTLAFILSRHTAYYNPYALSGDDTITFEKAKVVSVDSESLKPDTAHPELLIGSQNITVSILTGELKGKSYPVINNLNYDTNYHLKAGEEIVVSVSTSGSGESANININVNTPSRTPYLYIMAAVFVVLMCFVGGIRGFKSIVAIVFTLTSVIFIFIPMLYHGFSPVIAALILAAATACVTLLLTGGVELKSGIAIIGTIGGAAVSVGIELIFGTLTCTSGYTFGDTDSLLAISSHSGLKVGGLLFAAVLISSFGAVMDIAISVASAVNELYKNNTEANSRVLFLAGMNMGRDMMGTMANTLILAFTGTSLVTLIQIYTYNMLYYQVMNSNNISVEFIQALTGSIAVIITVPLVSFLSAKLLPLFHKRQEHIAN